MRSRVAVVIAVCAVLLVGAGIAAAQTPRARVRVRGPGAAAVERAIGKVLAGHGYRVVKRGKPALVVEGRVKGQKKASKASIELTARAGKKVVGRLRVRGASRKAAIKKVERQLWPAIERRLAGSKPKETPKAEAPVEPEDPAAAIVATTEPVETVVEAKPAAKPRRRPRRRRAASVTPEESAVSGSTSEASGDLEVSASAEPGVAAPAVGPGLSVAVGPEVVGRHFSYKDDVFRELREYDLTGTAAVGATAEWYPLLDRGGILAALGVAGNMIYAPGFTSEDVDGATYTTDTYGYAAGLRYRHGLGAIGLSGAIDFGAQSFSIDPEGEAMDPEVPNVSYRYVRVGAGVAVPFLTRFTATAAVGYRQVLDTGQIESTAYFPRASARGMDAEVGVRAAILMGFDLRIGAAVERYGFALDPEPGDERVAGGALDQYPRAFVRLGWTR